MKLFRISREKYIRDLSGEGTRLIGGRWNQKGIPVIYSSTHESLAALEVLVHSPISKLPDDLHLAVLNFPDKGSVRSINRELLPERWWDYPAPSSLKAIGAEWSNAKKHIALRVPSAVISNEFNMLLNPLHKDSNSISIDEIRPFSFDPRLTRP